MFLKVVQPLIHLPECAEKNITKATNRLAPDSHSTLQNVTKVLIKARISTDYFKNSMDSRNAVKAAFSFVTTPLGPLIL